MKGLSATEQAILRSLAYYDIFKYPLTTYECWKFLYDPQQHLEATDFFQVQKALGGLAQKNIIKDINGFWQLKESADYYYLRQERYRTFVSKLRRARRWARLFTFLDSVRFIAVVNSLGYQNPEADDDIDLLVITKAGRIWLTRWWLTGFAKLLGLRPNLKHQANGLCLSFYVADNALAFEPLMINNQDIYFHFWLPHMTVLYDDGVSGDLIRQNQNWLKCFPNLHLEFTPLWPAASRLAKFLRWVSLPFIRPMWERWCKKIQLRLLPSNLAAVANKDRSVVINDQVLKFHNPDRRAYYYKEWQTKLANLNI